MLLNGATMTYQFAFSRCLYSYILLFGKELGRNIKMYISYIGINSIEHCKSTIIGGNINRDAKQSTNTAIIQSSTSCRKQSVLSQDKTPSAAP